MRSAPIRVYGLVMARATTAQVERGRTIQFTRRRLQLTIEAVAHHMGISPHELRLIEAGEPTTDTDYRDAFAKAALALTEIGARK